MASQQQSRRHQEEEGSISTRSPQLLQPADVGDFAGLSGAEFCGRRPAEAQFWAKAGARATNPRPPAGCWVRLVLQAPDRDGAGDEADPLGGRRAAAGNRGRRERPGYHHLFADALRARLAREAGADAAAAFHRRASAWFGREGLLLEAIDHALAGDAAEDAATCIEALTPTLFATMSIHQPLAAWLAALPEPVVRARPLLCLAQAWLLIHRVELVPAAAWIDAAAGALPAAEDGTDPARGAVAATRAYIATVVPDTAPDHAIAWAERALADLAPDDVAFRSIAGISLGQAALALGQLDRAERAFADVAAAARAADSPPARQSRATAGTTRGSARCRGCPSRRRDSWPCCWRSAGSRWQRAPWRRRACPPAC